MFRLLFCLALVLAACEQHPSYPDRSVPEGFLENEGNREKGRLLFMAKCTLCHGTPEEGRMPKASELTPTPSDLTDPKYRRIDPAYLFWRIERGKQVEPYRSRGSSMPAWGPFLPEESIWQLVAYLRSRPVATRAF